MPVEARFPTRMGDGFMVEMTRSELRADIEQATMQAATRAKVPPLTADEQAHLLDIYASAAAFTAVDIGDQVVLSCDGGGSKMTGTDLQDLLESEQRLGQDILELWHIEYSYKAIKTILPFQQQVMQNAQLMLTAPDPVRRAAQPGLLQQARRPGRQLVRAAAPRATSPGRGRPSKRRWSTRRRTWCMSPTA